ncbi:MAG: dephospho-CoA kinase [Noviherbaspirillum sp.]
MIAIPFSIGLTGGIGSGKSLVADMFAALGATLIDTDQIAHALTAPGGLAMPAIAAQFGAGFVGADGAMDRARMRKQVFSDPAAKLRLEAILHPLIRIETERAASQAQGIYRIFVVPLLVESGKWKERVSRVLVVDCPEALQIARVMARNSLPEAQVRAIMAAQASRQARLAAADDVIVNDAGIAQLTPQVERLHALYSGLARGEPPAN